MIWRAVIAMIWICATPALGQDLPSCRVMVTPIAPERVPCLGQTRVRIAAAGDVLLHAPLQRKAYGHTDGFRAIWGAAEPFFNAADIAYVNLEGPVAKGMTRAFQSTRDPGAVFDNRVYTSYPLFNYHAQVIGDLLASGVDIVSTANNHALDRGALGVDLTITALRDANLAFTGTIQTGAPRNFVTETITALGRIAWIACSYSTNGITDRQAQVLGCFSDRAELLRNVAGAAARPDIAAVIVTPHWGFEYQSRPNARQKALAQDLADAGAAIVFGTHPHVVQPLDYLSGRDSHLTLVAYSTGNFVSGQGPLPRRTGIVVIAELCRVAPSARVPADLGADLLRQKLQVARVGWAPFYMATTPRGRELQYAGQDATGARASARQHAQNVLNEGELALSLRCNASGVLEVPLQ